MPFSKIKDYGTVSGATNAKYHQNGKFYDNHFMETDEKGIIIPDGDHPKPVIESSVAKKIVTEEPVLLEPVIDRPVIDFELLSWQEVKEQVKAAGGVWTNKVEGINYLRSL